jgi:hypothetical protein
MDKLEIERALLPNKPSIIFRTVGLVETNVFSGLACLGISGYS